MTGLLADINVQGYVDLLVARMRQDPWKLFWDHLQVQYFRFADVGLPSDAPDADVWALCQDRGLYLVTDNRNQQGPDSLETALRTRNAPDSLPVFTLADVRRLRTGREYAEQVVESLFDYLLQADNIRGTGRLFLP